MKNLFDRQINTTVGTVTRKQSAKNADIINAKDEGALAANSASLNTTYINTCIQKAPANGFVLVPADISYTEASLVLRDDVQVLLFRSNGSLIFLSKDNGTSLPIVKGGIVIKTQNADAIRLVSHNGGVSGEPYLEVLDATNGDVAKVYAKDITLYKDSGALATLAKSTGAERFNMQLVALGNGSTDDLGIYADANNDGIIEALVAYFVRRGNDAGALSLLKFLEISELAASPDAPAANKARLFSKDNGSGKTQLCVRFPTGAVQVIATEP